MLMLRIHMRICVRKECGIAMGTHDDEVALKNTPIDVTSSALASRQPSWCRSPYRRACQRMVKSVSGSYCWNAKTDPQARSHTLHTTQNQYKLFCDGVLGPDYLCHCFIEGYKKLYLRFTVKFLFLGRYKTKEGGWTLFCYILSMSVIHSEKVVM